MSRRVMGFVLLGLAGFAIGVGLGRRDPESERGRAESAGMAPSRLVVPQRPAPKPRARPRLSSESADAFAARLSEAGKLADFPTRYDRMRALFQEWKREDPDGAFEAWAATPEALGMGAIDSALRDLRRRDGFAAVLARVLAVDHEGLKLEALRTLGHELYDLAEKREAIDSLMAAVPEEVRAEVIAAAVQSWTMKGDFTEIVEWIEARRESFDAGGMAKLERAAVATLVGSRPEEAIRWLTARATPESLPEHLAFLAEGWARFAPNAAGEWLGMLPPGPQNDPALEAFVNTVRRDDPESAAHWAATITDPTRRRNALATVLSGWRKLDPKAAAEFEHRTAPPSPASNQP